MFNEVEENRRLLGCEQSSCRYCKTLGAEWGRDLVVGSYGLGQAAREGGVWLDSVHSLLHDDLIPPSTVVLRLD